MEDLTDILRTGLRLDERAPEDARVTTDYRGLKPREIGALAQQLLADLIDPLELAAHSITVAFPFPQIFRGSRHSLLCTANKVYEINENTWTLTELSFLSTDAAVERINPTAGLKPGGPWNITTGTWTADASEVHCTVAGANALIVQAAADLLAVITNGAVYRVSFYVTFNDETYSRATYIQSSIGGTLGRKISTSGWYYEDVTAGASGEFALYANHALCSIYTISVKLVSAAGSVTNSTQWAHADGGDTWALFNNAITLMRAPNGRHYRSDISKIRAGTFTRGRYITGGLDSTSIPASTNQIAGQWYSEVPHVQLGSNILGENWVQWSGIADTSFWWYYFPHIAYYGLNGGYGGGLTDGQFHYQDVLLKGDSGAMPMPWQGPVRRLEPFGMGVLAYGSEGVAYLFMVTEPTPTYGLRHLMTIGIGSRGAAGGTTEQQLMVDTSGYLWKIMASPEGPQPQRLGYREYFEDVLDEAFSISFDSEEGDWYICTETKCYILTSTGLCEAANQVYAVTLTSEGTKAVTIDSADTTVQIQSGPLAFGTDKFKRLAEVAIHSTDPTSVTLKVYCSVAQDTGHVLAGTYTFREDGRCVVNLTARSFIFRLEAEDYAGLQIDRFQALLAAPYPGGIGYLV